MSPVPPAMSRIASPLRGRTRRTNCVLPQPVQAARHQVVHQVVARGDAGEDAAAPAASSPRARPPRGRKRPCPSRRASSRGGRRCARPNIMPELPEVETTVRGLAPVLEGRRIASVEPRRAGPAPAVPARPAPAADRRARHRPRPPRQIRADRHRPRRHAGLPPRHVGPLADRSGRDRQARPSRDRDRRGAAARAQRPAPLRLARPRADRRARRATAPFAAMGPEPLGDGFRRRLSRARRSPAASRRSRRCCSTSGSSPGSATSMSARR